MQLIELGSRGAEAGGRDGRSWVNFHLLSRGAEAGGQDGRSWVNFHLLSQSLQWASLVSWGKDNDVRSSHSPFRAAAGIQHRDCIGDSGTYAELAPPKKIS